MENVNSGTHEKVIAVAVKKGKPSQLALKWAIENLVMETKSFILINARRKSTDFGRVCDYDYSLGHVCGEEVAQGLEQTCKDALNLQVKEIFSPFIMCCEKNNVHYEEVAIEDDDIAHGIADYVLKHNIDVLVLGAGSRGGLFRSLKGPDTASKIAKSSPYFCTVYTIGKGGIVSIKAVSTSTQNLSTVDSVEIQAPVIVSAQEPLLQPEPENKFEFRSPLGNYNDSDFLWEGHPPPDSDISFISSDKQFYDHLSSSYSMNSSNLNCGSFDLWQTSSSNSSSAMSSARTSSKDSYSSLGTMDEMRKLQLELMETKKLYKAACQEVLDAEMHASK